jgi:predicted phosphodiesterase
MKRAIVSDIHGNMEALEAVLRDAESCGVEEIYCLGDIVGYGPNPRECIDRAIQFQAGVLGNHDLGAIFDPEGFSSSAERAIFWTRRQLEIPNGDQQQVLKRWDFLAELPRVIRQERLLYLHGSVRAPITEYVFPEDVFNTRKLEKLFSMIEGVCFQGHTHVPGVFTEDFRFLPPHEIANRLAYRSGKFMVNVGSVGQPRDGDPRACYVIQGDEVLEFRRVEYPWQVTAGKIAQIPELDSFLGERLRDGR